MASATGELRRFFSNAASDSGYWISNRRRKSVTIPGTLRPDLENELLIWRPILAGKCRLEEVKSGIYTLVDLQKLNALLDMQSDIQQQAIDDAKKDQKKGGE